MWVNGNVIFSPEKLEVNIPEDSYTKIFPAPNEAYADFLARLRVSISHSVVEEEAKVQIEKLLTYENANQKCQRAITPIHETGNIWRQVE